MTIDEAIRQAVREEVAAAAAQLRPQSTFTAREGAEYLRISESMFYELAKDGDIRTYKIGNRTRVTLDELRAFEQRQMEKHDARDATA